MEKINVWTLSQVVYLDYVRLIPKCTSRDRVSFNVVGY